MSSTATAILTAPPGAPPEQRPARRWRTSLESVAIPVGAVLVALLLFGVFCGLAGASPFSVYHSIYRAAFGSWYAFQNTLIRAAPIMLCALCTALPMRLGLVVIGNEGALVMAAWARCWWAPIGSPPRIMWRSPPWPWPA